MQNQELRANLRDESVDVAKGILTFGMVFAHTIQFLASYRLPFILFSELTNLVSFSGFVFFFGFGCYRAYLSKSTIPWRRVLFNCLKMYLAFVFSASAYRFIVDRSLDIASFRTILLTYDLPPYSEFLISFAVLILFGTLLKFPVRFAATSIWSLALVALPLLLVCYYPAYVPFPGGHLLTKGKFPVVEYFPLFLMGAYAAKNNKKVRASAAIFCIAVVTYYLLLVSRGQMVLRFPPSAQWIVVSAFAVCLYYWAAIGVERFTGQRIRLQKVRAYLTHLGKRILFYLIFSNVCFFISITFVPMRSKGPVYIFEYFIILMIVAFCTDGLMSKLKSLARAKFRKS